MIPVDVRLLTEEDVRLLAATQPAIANRWRYRLVSQERGDYEFFVAWRDDEPLGRVILRPSSAYHVVRDRLGYFPEMNGLFADVKNEGVGTQIIEAVEVHARSVSERIGLGVALDNPGAHRLYVRLGYVEWDGGHVTAEWQERDDDGRPIATHRDEGVYLVKLLPPNLGG